jgi:hypothetical protein
MNLFLYGNSFYFRPFFITLASPLISSLMVGTASDNCPIKSGAVGVLIQWFALSESNLNVNLCYRYVSYNLHIIYSLWNWRSEISILRKRRDEEHYLLTEEILSCELRYEVRKERPPLCSPSLCYDMEIGAHSMNSSFTTCLYVQM